MNMTYRVVRAVAQVFFRVCGHWEVIGVENIPRTGPVIICPNHASYVDPPLFGSAFNREGRFMARKELWKVKGFPWLLPRLGVFPIDKDRPDRTAIRFALDALKQGLVLGMFPEGTRSLDGTLLPGEPGVALFVQKSGAPVVPCALLGTHDMLPVHDKKLRCTKIKVVFGEPIFFTPDTSRQEIVTTIMRAIAALMTEHGVPMTAAEDRSCPVV